MADETLGATRRQTGGRAITNERSLPAPPPGTPPVSGLARVRVVRQAAADYLDRGDREIVSRGPQPRRDGRFGWYGLVTSRFSADPNPPLPTGTVTLRVVPIDSRHRFVAPDNIAFEYGRQGG